MSGWPPVDPAAHFASPDFADKMRLMTKKLVRLFPSHRTLAEEVVYDTLANIFLGEAKAARAGAKRWRSEEVSIWLSKFSTEGHFDAYLFRAAYRGVVRGMRKKLGLHEQPFLKDPQDVRPQLLLQNEEEIEEVNALIERVATAIPGDEREILYLLVEGIPVAEIAECLEVSERAVYRVRSDLREILWKIKLEREES